jgi:DHA1 family multidrug resistance protein-like MFS transporter
MFDNCTFRVVLVALVLSLIGFKIVWPFLPLYIGELGVPRQQLSMWAGVLEAVEEASTALVAPVWGVLGDRFGSRAMVLRALLSGAVVVALLVVASSVWVVLVLMMLSGALAAVIAPLNALVAAATPENQLASRMGMLLSGIFVANAAGPVVGGVIADRFGFGISFVCGAGFLVVAAALIALFVPRPGGAQSPSGSGTERRAAGMGRTLRRVWGVPGVAVLVVLSATLYFSNMLLYPVLPLFVRDSSGVPVWHGQPQVSTAAGIALGITGIAAILTAARAQWAVDRWGCQRVLTWGVAASGLLYGSMLFTDSYWYLVAVRMATGLLLGLALAALAVMVGLIVPADMKSSAYGVVAAAESAGSSSGFLVGGAVGSSAGLSLPFLITGAGLVAAALLGRRLRSVSVAARPVVTQPV